MSSVDTSPRDVKAIVARYKAMGLIGGLFLGAVAGVMIAGPNFREWSGMRSLVTIAGSLGIGAIAGYFAGELAVGGHASGSGAGIHSGSGDSSETSGLDASGGGSGDGGGGGDGGDS